MSISHQHQLSRSLAPSTSAAILTPWDPTPPSIVPGQSDTIASFAASIEDESTDEALFFALTQQSRQVGPATLRPAGNSSRGRGAAPGTTATDAASTGPSQRNAAGEERSTVPKWRSTTYCHIRDGSSETTGVSSSDTASSMVPPKFTSPNTSLMVQNADGDSSVWADSISFPSLTPYELYSRAYLPVQVQRRTAVEFLTGTCQCTQAIGEEGVHPTALSPMTKPAAPGKRGGPTPRNSTSGVKDDSGVGRPRSRSESAAVSSLSGQDTTASANQPVPLDSWEQLLMDVLPMIRGPVAHHSLCGSVSIPTPPDAPASDAAALVSPKTGDMSAEEQAVYVRRLTMVQSVWDINLSEPTPFELLSYTVGKFAALASNTMSQQRRNSATQSTSANSNGPTTWPKSSETAEGGLTSLLGQQRRKHRHRDQRVTSMTTNNAAPDPSIMLQRLMQFGFSSSPLVYFPKSVLRFLPGGSLDYGIETLVSRLMAAASSASSSTTNNLPAISSSQHSAAALVREYEGILIALCGEDVSNPHRHPRISYALLHGGGNALSAHALKHQYVLNMLELLHSIPTPSLLSMEIPSESVVSQCRIAQVLSSLVICIVLERASLPEILHLIATLRKVEWRSTDGCSKTISEAVEGCLGRFSFRRGCGFRPGYPWLSNAASFPVGDNSRAALNNKPPTPSAASHIPPTSSASPLNPSSGNINAGASPRPAAPAKDNTETLNGIIDGYCCSLSNLNLTIPDGTTVRCFAVSNDNKFVALATTQFGICIGDLERGCITHRQETTPPEDAAAASWESQDNLMNTNIVSGIYCSHIGGSVHPLRSMSSLGPAQHHELSRSVVISAEHFGILSGPCWSLCISPNNNEVLFTASGLKTHVRVSFSTLEVLEVATLQAPMIPSYSLIPVRASTTPRDVFPHQHNGSSNDDDDREAAFSTGATVSVSLPSLGTAQQQTQQSRPGREYDQEDTAPGVGGALNTFLPAVDSTPVVSPAYTASPFISADNDASHSGPPASLIEVLERRQDQSHDNNQTFSPDSANLLFNHHIQSTSADDPLSLIPESDNNGGVGGSTIAIVTSGGQSSTSTSRNNTLSSVSSTRPSSNSRSGATFTHAQQGGGTASRVHGAVADGVGGLRDRGVLQEILTFYNLPTLPHGHLESSLYLGGTRGGHDIGSGSRRFVSPGFVIRDISKGVVDEIVGGGSSPVVGAMMSTAAPPEAAVRRSYVNNTLLQSSSSTPPSIVPQSIIPHATAASAPNNNTDSRLAHSYFLAHIDESDRQHFFPHVVSVGNPILSQVDGHVHTQPHIRSGSPSPGTRHQPPHHPAAVSSFASPPRRNDREPSNFSVDAMMSTSGSSWVGNHLGNDEDRPPFDTYRPTNILSNNNSVSPPMRDASQHHSVVHRLAQMITSAPLQSTPYSHMVPPVTSTRKQVSLISGYVDQLNISVFVGDDFFGTLVSIEGGFSVHIKQNFVIECVNESGDSVVGTLPRCSARDNTDGTIWRFVVVSWNKGQFTAMINSQFIELHDIPNTSVVSERRESRAYMSLASTSATFLMSAMGHVTSLHFWAGPAPRSLLTSLAANGRFNCRPFGDLHSATTSPEHHQPQGGSSVTISGAAGCSPAPHSAAATSRRQIPPLPCNDNDRIESENESGSSSLFSSSCSSDVSEYDPLEDCMLLVYFPLDEGSGLWVGECVRGDVHLITTHFCATWDSSSPSPLDVCPSTSDGASQISPYLLKRAAVLETLNVDLSTLHQESSSTAPSYLPFHDTATLVPPAQTSTNLYGRRCCHLPISVVARSKLLRSKDQMILLYDDSITSNNSFSQQGMASLASGGSIPLTRYALHLSPDLCSVTRVARLKTSPVTQYSTLFALDNKGKFAYSFSQRFLSLSRAEVRSVYLACDEVKHWATVITEKKKPPSGDDGVASAGRLQSTTATPYHVSPSSSGFHNPFGFTLHGGSLPGDASSSFESSTNMHNVSTSTRGYDTLGSPDSSTAGGGLTPQIFSAAANTTSRFTASVPPNAATDIRGPSLIAPPLGYAAEPMNAHSWLSHRVCAVLAIESYDLVMAPPELSHISIDLLHHLIGQLQTVAAEALDVRRDKEAFIAVTDGHWTMRMFALGRLILHSVQHFCNDGENRSAPTSTTRRMTTATTVEAAAVKAISSLRPLCWRLLESKPTDSRMRPLAAVLSEIQWLVLARSLTPVQKAQMIIKGLTSKAIRNPDSLASSFSATHSPGNSPPQFNAPTPSQRRNSVSDPMATPDTPLLLSWLRRGSIEGIVDATIAAEPHSTEKIASLVSTVVDYTMNPKSHPSPGGGVSPSPFDRPSHSRNLSTVSSTSSILPKHPTPTIDPSWALIAAIVSAGDRNRQDVVVALVDILLERCDGILSQICDAVSAAGNHRDPTDEDDIRSRSQDNAPSPTFLSQVIISSFIPFFVTVARKCPGWINEEQQADIRDLFHAASTAMVDQSLAPTPAHPSSPPNTQTPVSIAFQCRQVYDVVTTRNDVPWRIALDSNKTKEIALTIGGDSTESIPSGGRRILFVPSVASTTATTAPALRECAPWGNNRATFAGDGTLIISGNGNVSMSVVRLYNKSVVWDPVSILCASLRHLQNRVIRALFSGAAVVAQGWDAPGATSRREVNLLPILKFGLKSRTLATYGVVNPFGVKEGPSISPHSAAAVNDRSFTSSTFDAVGTSTTVQPPAAAILTGSLTTNLMGSNGAATPPAGGLPPLCSSGTAHQGGGGGATAALDILYGKGYMKGVVDAAVVGMRGLIIPSMRPAFQALLAVLVHCGSTIPQAEEELKFKWLGGEWGLWLQGNNKKASMTRLISLCDWIINNVSYPSAASLMSGNTGAAQSLSSRERELSGEGGTSGRRADKSGSSRSAFESMHRRRSSGSSRRSTLRVHHNLSSEILDHVRSLFISGVAPEAIERRAVSRTLYALHCCRGHRILKDMVHSTVAIAKSVCPTHRDGIYVDLSKTPIDRTTLDFAIASLVCFAEMPPEPYSSELSSLTSRKWLDVGGGVVSPSSSPNIFDDNASASMTIQSVSSASGGGPEFEPSTSTVRHFPERLVGCGIGLELGVREEFIRSCFIVKRIVAQCTIPNMVALDKPFCTNKKTVDGALNAASVGAPQLLKVLSVVCVGFDAVDMQLMQQMITTAFREEDSRACTNSSSANTNPTHQRRGTDSSDADNPLCRRKRSSRVFWNGFGEGSSRRTSRLQNSWRMQTESDLPTGFVPTTATTDSFGATSPSRRNRAEGTSIFFDPTVENFPHHSNAAAATSSAASTNSMPANDDDPFFQTLNFGTGLGSENLARSTDSTNTIACNIPSFSSDDSINAEDSTYYGFINIIRCVMGVVVQSMSEEPVLPGLGIIHANHADLQKMMASRYDISSLARVFPNCFNLVVPGLKIQSVNEGWRVHGNPSPSASSVAPPKRVDPVSHEVCHIVPENGWPLDVIPNNKHSVGRIDGDFTGLPGVYYYEVTITHGCLTSVGIVAGGDYTLHLTQLVPADATATGPGRPADGEAVPMPSAPLICAYNSDGSVTGSCVVFPSVQARLSSPTTNIAGDALHQWPRYGAGDTIGVGIIPSSMHVFLTLNSLYLGVVGTWNPPSPPEGDEGEIEELEKGTYTNQPTTLLPSNSTPAVTRFQKTQKEYVRPLLCVPKTPSIAEQPDFIVNFGSTAPFAFDFRFLHPLLFTPETAPSAVLSSASINLGNSRHMESFSASYTFPEVPPSPVRSSSQVAEIPLRLRPFASWQFIADACCRLLAFVSELLGNFHQVQAQNTSSGLYNQSYQALVVASDCIDLIATNLQSTTCDTPMLAPSQLSSHNGSTTSAPPLRPPVSAVSPPSKAPIAIYDGLLQQCISVLHRLIPIFADNGTKFIVVTFRALQKLLRVPHPSLQMSAACAIAPLLSVISNVITAQRSGGGGESVVDGSFVSAEEVRDFIKTVCDLSCPTEPDTGRESHFVTAPRANYSHFIRQMHQTGKNVLDGQLRCSELVPFTPLWCRCDPRYVTVLHPQFAKMLPDAQRTILMGSVLPRSGICSFTVSICRSDMPKGHCLKGGYFIGIALSNIAPLSPSTNTQSWKSARPPIVWALHDTSAQLPHAVNPTVQPNNFQRTFGSGDVITVVVNRDKCTVAFYRDRIFLKELFSNIPSDLDVAPFVQLYNSDAAAVLYPGFSTTVVTPAIFMSSLCCGILRSMLTLEPFRSPAAQILCSELAIKAKAGEVPLTTLSVFGSLPDIRDLTLTYNEKQFAQDSGTEGVARVRLSRIGCRGQEIVVVSGSGEQYFGNVSSLKLPLVQRLPGFHLPSSNSPADFVAAVAAATTPPSGTSPSPSQDEGFEKLLVQLLDFMSEIVHPLVEGDAISTVERQVRISILKEEKATWDGFKHDMRRYAFKAIQRGTSVPIQPVPCPLVACNVTSSPNTKAPSSSSAEEGLPALIPGPAVKVLNPAPPLHGYAFSAGLSHPAYLFPPSFCGRLATVPSGCGVEEIPFVAIAEPAIPKTGKFSIRCQLIRGHAGQMLGGGYFFGICCGTLKWDRRELNSTPPEVWALPDVEDNPWKLRHSANERPLTLARPSPRCVIVSGDTVRLEIDREEGTMHAYRTPNNTTEEVSIGLVFDNIPKGTTLYPFVQMYNCDAVASLVSDDPRGYSLRSTVQYPEMAHSLASESSTSSKRVCDSCLAAYLETKLTSPNWYKCIECADYNLCQPCFFRYKHVHHNFAQMNPSTLLLSPRRPRILAEGMHVVAPSSGVEFLTCSAETVSVSEAKCFLKMDARDNKGGGCAVWGLTGGSNPCFTVTANGPSNRSQAAGGSGTVTSAMSKRILLPVTSATTSTSQNSFAAATSDGHNIHLPPFASPVFVGIAPFLTCRNKTPDEIVAMCSSSVTITMCSEPERLKYPEVLAYCSDPRIRCNFQEGSASLSPHGFSEGSIISIVVDASKNTAKIYRDWVCVGMQELPPSWRCLDANNDLPTSSLVGFVAFSSGDGVSVVIGNPVAPFLEGVIEKAYPDSNTFLVRNQVDKTKCAIVSGDSIRMVLKPCNPAVVQKLLSQFKGESTRGRLFTVVDGVLEPCHLKAIEQTQQLVTTDQGRTEMAPVFVATVVTAESGTIYRSPETLFCSEDDIDSDPCPVVLAKYSRSGGTVKDAFVISRILLIIMLMLDSESGAIRIGNILRKHMPLLSQLGSVVIANNAPLNYVLELRAAIASTAKVLNFTEDRLAVPLPPLISRVVGGMAHRKYTNPSATHAAYNSHLVQGSECYFPSPVSPNAQHPSILLSVVSGQYAGCCLLVGDDTKTPVVTEAGVVVGCLVYCSPDAVSSEIRTMVKTHASVLVDEMCCVPALQCGGSPWWLVENGLTSSRYEHVLRSRSITGGGSGTASDILTSAEGEWLGEFSTTHPQVATQTVALTLDKAVENRPDGSIGLTGVVTVRHQGGNMIRGQVTGHHQRYTRRLVLVFTCPAASSSKSIQEIIFHFNGTIDADGTGIRGNWKQNDGTLGHLQLISLGRMAVVHSHRSRRVEPGAGGSEVGHQRETIVTCSSHSVPPLFDILEPSYEVIALSDTSTTLQRMVVLLSRHICVLYSVRCGEVFGTDDDVLGQHIVNFHGHPLADSYVYMQYKLRGFSKVCSMIAQAGALVNHPDCKPWNHASISQLILGATKVVGAAELAVAAPGVYWDGLHGIVGSTLACGTIYRHLIVERLVQYIRLAPPGFLDRNHSALLALLDPLVSWLDLKTSDPVLVSVAKDVSSVIELIMCINPSATVGKLSRLPLYSLMCLRKTAKAIHNVRPVPGILDKVGVLPTDAKSIDPQCVFGNFVSGELRVGKIMSTVPAKSVFARHLSNRDTVPLDPSASANGKYYYEVQLPERLAAFAIGWGTSNHSASPGSHVGTDTHSFAFTGVRVNSCGVRVEDYRIRDAVVQGSVIGCMLDTVEGTVAWSVNGVCGPSLPIPITLPKSSYELYPFVSTGSCGGLKIHLSAVDFRRAPIGYSDTRGNCFRSIIPPFDLDALSPCPPRSLKYYTSVADYLEEATAGSTRPVPFTTTHPGGVSASSSASMPHLSIPPPMNTMPNDSLSGNPLNASSSEKRASGRASVVGFDSPIIAASPMAEMEALQRYITHVRSIESCLAICLPYIDLNSARKPQSTLQSPSGRSITSQKHTSGCIGTFSSGRDDDELPYGDSLAECFMMLRSVIRPSFRHRLIDLPPVERVTGSPMSVTIRCTELHSSKPRTPEVAVEKSLLRQLYVQIGHYTAKQFAQTPLCSVLLHLTESGHTPQDLGGPYRQMWTEICEEIMRHPDTCFPHTTYHRNPLFRFSNNSKRLFLVPDFEANTHLELALFVFLGKIMGHMVRAKTSPLALDISPYVWKHLVEESVSINDYYTDVDSVVQNSMEDPDFLFSELADEVIPNFAENRAKLMQGIVGGFSTTQRGSVTTTQKPHMGGSNAHLYNNSLYASSFKGFRSMGRVPPNHHSSPVAAAAHSSSAARSGIVGSGHRDLGISQGIPETPTNSHSALPRVNITTSNAYDDEGCSIPSSPAGTLIGSQQPPATNDGSSSSVSVFAGIPFSAAAAHGVEEGLGSFSPANSGVSPPLSGSVNPPAYTQSPHTLRRLVQRHSSVLSTGSEATTVVDEEELEFRRQVAAYSLVHSMDDQIAHIQKGLWSVVPRRVTRCLRWQDLEIAVCGKSTPTAAELRPVFQMALCTPRDVFFWKIVEEMTGAQRAQLLCFASGQTRLPLASRIQVLENSESLTHLPRAQSCSFLITIPKYDDFSVMKAKMLMALTSSAMELA